MVRSEPRLWGHTVAYPEERAPTPKRAATPEHPAPLAKAARKGPAVKVEMRPMGPDQGVYETSPASTRFRRWTA